MTCQKLSYFRKRSMVLRSRDSCLKAFARVLKCCCVDLASRIALTEDLHCCWSATWLKRFGCPVIEPAYQRPGENDQQGNPYRRTQHHQRHAEPAETISPHHDGILAFLQKLFFRSM